MATIWESRFNNHPLWTILGQLDTQLADIEAPSDADQSDSLSRILWLTELLRVHMNTEDARGYSATALDNVQRALSANVQTNVSQYVADPNVYMANLRTAADSVDSVLDQMGLFPIVPAKGAAISAGQAAAAYERASVTALTTLNEQFKDLESNGAAMKKTVADETQRLVEARETFEKTAESTIQQTIDSLSSTHFAAATTTLDKIDAAAEESEATLAELRGMRQEGSKVLEAVANRAVASDYRRNARNKAVAGWIWDTLGLLIGGTSITLLLVHLFRDNPNATTTQLALTRLAVSIGGIGLAALCFGRGSQNHKESRRAKRADIRLSTVGPFISSQTPAFKDAIVQGMADRIYLQGILDDEESVHDEGLLARSLARVRSQQSDIDEESPPD